MAVSLALCDLLTVDVLRFMTIKYYYIQWMTYTCKLPFGQYSTIAAMLGLSMHAPTNRTTLVCSARRIYFKNNYINNNIQCLFSES